MKKIVKGDEYKKALEELFEETFKDKDLDAIEKSFVKTDKEGKEYFDDKGYVQNLRKTLASLQEVSTEELENLAKERTQNILDYLIKEKKIDKNAVVIDEKIKVQTDKKDKWAKFKLNVSVKNKISFTYKLIILFTYNYYNSNISLMYYLKEYYYEKTTITYLCYCSIFWLWNI